MCRVGVETAAVIVDGDPQPAVAAAQSDLSARGVRVLQQVGQALGDGEVGGALDLRRKPLETDILIGMDGYRHGAPSGLGLDGREEPPGGEQARMHSPSQVP